MIILLKIALGVAFLFVLVQIISFLLFGNRNVFKYCFDELMFRSVLGSLALVCIFSLIFTKGNSVFLIALPIIGYIIWLSSREIKTEKFFKLKMLENEKIPFIAFFVFSILFTYFLITGSDHDGYKLLPMDQAFYASLVNTIDLTGVESTKGILDPLSSEIRPVPYHFYEVWLSIIIKRVFSFNAQLSMYGIVLAYTLFIFFSTAYSILRSISKKGYLLLLIPAAILFINLRGLLYFIGPNYNINSILFEGNQKYLYPLVFFLFGLKAYFSRKKELALMMILLLPVINVVFMPAVISSTFAYLFYAMFSYRNSINKSYIKQLSPILITITLYIVLFAFYLFVMIPKGENMSGLQTSIGGIFFVMLEDGLKFLIFNSIFIGLIIFLVIKKRMESDRFELLIFFSLLLMFGLFARAIMDNNQNSYQIFQSVNMFVTFGLFIIVIEYFINDFMINKGIVLASLVFISLMMLLQDNYKASGFVLFNSHSRYSNEYITKIASKKFSNTIGIKCVNPKTRIMKRRNPAYCGVSEYMPIVNNITFSLVINPIDLLPEKGGSFIVNLQRAEFINSSIFLKNNKNEDGKIDSVKYNLMMIDYLKKFNPEFCIVENGTILPKFLQEYVTGFFEDKSSKEKFYLLKTTKTLSNGAI